MPYSILKRYEPPPLKVTVAPLTNGPRARREASCDGRYATKGRTNGMPWEGMSPCTESTVINAHTAPRAGREFDNLSTIVLAWKFASTKTLWWDLAYRLRDMADAVEDNDLAGDLATLAAVAYRHGDSLLGTAPKPWWV